MLPGRHALGPRVGRVLLLVMAIAHGGLGASSAMWPPYHDVLVGIQTGEARPILVVVDRRRIELDLVLARE